MIRLKAKEKVANGARWLDENFPGWEKQINIQTLDLTDPWGCICGQVFRKKVETTRSGSGYGYALYNLFSEANSWITAIVKSEPVSRRRACAEERAAKVSEALGFNGTEANQREWKRLLKERATAKASSS